MQVRAQAHQTGRKGQGQWEGQARAGARAKAGLQPSSRGNKRWGEGWGKKKGLGRPQLKCKKKGEKAAGRFIMLRTRRSGARQARGGKGACQSAEVSAIREEEAGMVMSQHV